MDHVTFYRDSTDIFKCEVSVEGAALSESKVRLVLDFDNGQTYMFKGSINGDGICEISVPKLKEEDGSGGVATLEVIAENAFFEPWVGNFGINSKKAVRVEGVKVNTDSEKRVIVSNVNSDKPVSNDHRIVETILKTYKPSKRLLAELNDYEPTLKVKQWGKRVFGKNLNTNKAKYTMMVVEERAKKLKKRK